MKKILLSIIAIGISASSFAQWSTSGNNTIHTNPGNVGVGTSSPLAKFETHSETGLGPLRAVGPNGYILIDNVGSGESYYQANSAHRFQGTGNKETFTILGNGNAGLGTTNPLATLHVRGTSNSLTGGRNALLLDNGNASGNRSSEIIWSANGAPKWEMGNDFAANGEQSFYLFDLENTANPSFLVNSHGNVGIGTNDPKGYKLAVAGSIIAESVTVKMQGTWPDYVFNKDFKLLPLSELKRYIYKNKHLPEIPSDKEVGEKGLELAEINRQLTKKIEELTLYLIAKDESDQLLKKRIEQLEKLTKPKKIRKSQ